MDFFRKTLGGLKGSYYLRHFIFGAAIYFLGSVALMVESQQN